MNYTTCISVSGQQLFGFYYLLRPYVDPWDLNRIMNDSFITAMFFYYYIDIHFPEDHMLIENGYQYNNKTGT